MPKQLLSVALLGILLLSACVAPHSAGSNHACPTGCCGIGPGAGRRRSASRTVPPGFDGRSWPSILDTARGQTVNFYMWGGSDVINGWVTGYVAQNPQGALRYRPGDDAGGR